MQNIVQTTQMFQYWYRYKNIKKNSVNSFPTISKSFFTKL